MAISIHTTWIHSAGWDKREAYSLIKECGFDGVDFDLSQSWNRSEIVSGINNGSVFDSGVDNAIEEYKDEIDAINDVGLEIYQAHAPFPPYVEGIPQHKEYAVEVYKKCLEFCQRLSIPSIVIHGISKGLVNKEMDWRKCKEENFNLYSALIPKAKETGVCVLLENLFTRVGKRHIADGCCSDPREAVELIDRLNEKAGEKLFALCFDTGHLHITGRDQKEYIEILGNRIEALHLHDNFGEDDLHRMPYTGNIDWDSVLDTLKEVKYNGVINFETYRQLEVPHELAPSILKAMAVEARYFEKRIFE